MRDLGISRRQLYRERHCICTKIAQQILERRSSYSPQIASLSDLHDFNITRARAAADHGDPTYAFAIFEDLANTVGSTRRRLEVTCEWIDVALEYGEYAMARELLVRSWRLAPKLQHSGEANIVAGRLALASAKLSRKKGEMASATSNLARAAAITQSLCTTVDGRRLFPAVALERASRLAFHGQFDEACEVIDDALALTRRHGSGEERIYCSLLLWRAAYENCGRQVQGSADLDDRLKLLYELRERARASGFYRGVIEATYIIGERFAYRNRQTEAFAALREAVEMARAFPNRSLRGQVLLGAADCLSGTRWWSQAPALVREAEPDLVKMGWSWGVAQGTKAEYFLNRKDYAQAWSAGLITEEVALGLKSERMLASAWRSLAFAAHAMGRPRDSRDRIAEAVTYAERSGTAMSVARTYEFAGVILRSERYRTAARELRHALATERLANTAEE
jgi:tetratricopeptide (TPR) repeat protein